MKFNLWLFRNRRKFLMLTKTNKKKQVASYLAYELPMSMPVKVRRCPRWALDTPFCSLFSDNCKAQLPPRQIWLFYYIYHLWKSHRMVFLLKILKDKELFKRLNLYLLHCSAPWFLTPMSPQHWPSMPSIWGPVVNCSGCVVTELS